MTNLVTFLLDFAQRNFKAFVTGILLCPAYFYGAGALTGVTPGNHWAFLMGHKASPFTLAQTYLEGVSENMDNYELRTHSEQVRLTSLVVREEAFGNAEKVMVNTIANNSQDIVRALLALQSIYVRLVKENQHSSKTQEHLLSTYSAYFNVLVDSTTSREKAWDELVPVYLRLNDFPDFVRDDVEAELLRHITYLTFRKQGPGIEKERENWLEKAKILSARNPVPGLEYRRKYYWVDFALLVEAVHRGDVDGAEGFFGTLRDRLADTAFLRGKFLQHRDVIDPDRRDLWDEFLTLLPP